MKRFVIAVLIGAAAAASLASPVLAQKPQEPDLTPLQEQDAAKKREHEAVDKDYQRAVKGRSTDASATKIDPWANMRAPSDTKTKK